MANMTEYEWYAACKKVCAQYGLTERQQQYVEMYCSENGSDCGERCWQVAFDTLEMIIDQNQLVQVGNNEI